MLCQLNVHHHLYLNLSSSAQSEIKHHFAYAVAFLVRVYMVKNQV